MQFHVAFGDDDIVMTKNDPTLMRALFAHEPFRAVPLVLLHCYPFHRQAGYLASIYPNVYVDLGLTIPIVGPGAARVLAETLELCPTRQLLASTDGHMEPEFQWFGVFVWRWALARVLGQYVEWDILEHDAALATARAILHDNALRVYQQRRRLNRRERRETQRTQRKREEIRCLVIASSWSFSIISCVSLCPLRLCVSIGSRCRGDMEGDKMMVDPKLLEKMEWRLVGPFRGGRCVAVAGDPSDMLTFYFGSTGGGVWKTRDGGATWRNVSDGFLGTASVGALAVAQSDPNVLYVGMGETTIRGNVAHGDGVYKSSDAGATWTHCGLAETRHIAKVRSPPGRSRSRLRRRLRACLRIERGARRLSLAGRRRRRGSASSSAASRPGRLTSRWTRTTRASSTPPSGTRSARRTA